MMETSHGSEGVEIMAGEGLLAPATAIPEGRQTLSQKLFKRITLPSRPFRGVLPFRCIDRTIFTGREEEVRMIFRLVCTYRGTLLYGDSGAGKSSLINAGLIPVLIDEGFEIERLRVQPVENEEIVIERISLTEEEHSEALPSIFTSDTATHHSVRQTVSVARLLEVATQQPRTAPRVFIFDQFEELVTLFEDAKVERVSFDEARKLQAGVVGAIQHLLELPRSNVKLLFAFREDYFSRLTEHFSGLPRLKDQGLRLISPSTDCLRRIIERPFQVSRVNHTLDTGTRDHLVNGFTALSSNGLINLTEVQIACDSLWSDPKEEQRFCNVPDPKTAVRSIFDGYVPRTVEALPARLHDCAFAALCRLVTPSAAGTAGTRNIVSRNDLIRYLDDEDGFKPTLAKEALDALCNTAHLVFRQIRGATEFYEIASEFLVPGILARLPGVERAREVLEANRLKGEVDRQTKTLKAQKASLTRQRQFLVGLVGVALAAAVAAYFQFRSANRERQIAVIAGEDATKKRLEAEDAAQKQVEVANALEKTLKESERRFDASDKLVESLQEQIKSGTVTKQTVQIAVNSAVEPLRARLTAHTKEITTARFSPDGSAIVTGGLDNKLLLWSNTGKLLATDDNTFTTGAVRFARFFPLDGRILATGRDSSFATLFRPNAEKQRLATDASLIRLHQNLTLGFEFNPANPRMSCSASSDGTTKLLLWNASDAPQELKTWQQTRARPNRDVTFSADGKRAAASGSDGRLYAYSCEPPYDLIPDAYVGSPLRFDGTQRNTPVRAPRYSPADSNLLVAGAGDKTVVWWRIGSNTKALYRDDGEGKSGPWHHDGAVLDIAFNKTGTHLATIATDGLCLIWDVPTSETVASVPTEIKGRLFALEWKDNNLALVGEDGWLEIWNTKDVEHPQQVFAVQAHQGVASGLSFDPSGNTLLTWSGFLDGYFDLKFAGIPEAKGNAATNVVFPSRDQRPTDNTVALWAVEACTLKGWTKH